jgi:hypothetical protein
MLRLPSQPRPRFVAVQGVSPDLRSQQRRRPVGSSNRSKRGKAPLQ